MKKKDFTIKGTKLPKIPKGSMYGEYIFTRSYKNLATKEYSNGIIYATSLDKDNNGFLVPVSLPLIERLAEEQGMLYEKEEERDWSGVRFKKIYGDSIIIIGEKNNSGFYPLYKNGGLINHLLNDDIVEAFSSGTWIEVKEEVPEFKNDQIDELIDRVINDLNCLKEKLKNYEL